MTLYGLSLWSAPVPAIPGSIDTQMSIYLNLGQKHSLEESQNAYNLLKQEGLIPKEATGTWSELTVLKHLAQAGDVVDPQLIYGFYINRLREKSDAYSGYAVKYLLEKNRDLAFNDIATVILESLQEGKNTFAEKIFDQVRSYARGIANNQDKEIYEYQRWMKKLSLTLTSGDLKTQVNLARAELQAQIKSCAQTEKLLKNNPALQQEVSNKLNNFFASRGVIQCLEVLAIK